MTTIISRLNLTEIFCDVDDFYLKFEKSQEKLPKLVSNPPQKKSTSRLCLSEVMTIVIAFHGSGYRTFKEFYLKQVMTYWRREFPHLVSYNRFVELMPWSLVTRCRKNMKNRLLPLGERLLLQKRCLIESVNDQLKNICQIEHSRGSSPFNLGVNLIAGLVAYTYHPVKPSVNLKVEDLMALPPI